MLPTRIDRQLNTPASGFPALGSDADPTALADAAATAYLKNGNCFRRIGAVNFGTAQRLVIAAIFEGVASPRPIKVALSIYDETSRRWFAWPGSVVSVIPGQLAFVPIPVLNTPGQNNPEIEIALVADATDMPDGVYSLLVGMDFGGAGANARPLGPSRVTFTADAPAEQLSAQPTNFAGGFIVQNQGAAVMWIGETSGVNASGATRGLKVLPGASVTFDATDASRFYAYSVPPADGLVLGLQ